MTRSEPGAVVVRLPEKYAAEAQAHYQRRLQEWRARKGWRVQIEAQQAAPRHGGEQAGKGAA